MFRSLMYYKQNEIGSFYILFANERIFLSEILIVSKFNPEFTLISYRPVEVHLF